MATYRKEKINNLLRKELSEIIARQTPVEGALITINEIICSDNLKSAKVKFSILPEKQAGSALKILKKTSGEFCHELQKRTKLKWIPSLNWEIDEGYLEAMEIMKILT